MEHFRRLAEEYGPKVCVWRYDTIISSSVTTREFHIESFTKLARALTGVTDEVVISFAHLYKKTLTNMNRAASENDFTWSDPSTEWKRDLVHQLIDIAMTQGIRVTLCSQPTFLVPGGGEARCVDADRLQAVAGKQFTSKLKGNRKKCGCFEARDIGAYDTCPHGCVYCYAVRDQDLARRRFKQHDPKSEYLFETPIAPAAKSKLLQLPLFNASEEILE